MPSAGSYHEVRIDSEEGLLNFSRHLPTKDEPQWWMFRGTSRPYRMQTSLERALSGAGVSLAEAPEIEKQMLKEFKRRAHFYVDPLPSEGDILGWWALMQHYGAPTRLLDWTYSFFAAAFFALSDAVTFPLDRREPAIVWALYRNDFKLSDQAPVAFKAYTAAKDGTTWQRDLGRADADHLYDGINACLVSLMDQPESSVWSVNAFRLNERLSVQQGVFLCPGSVGVPFEDNLSAGKPTPANLIRFELATDPDARRAMLSALHRMNINSGSLFPGLDGFARSLVQTPWLRFRLRPQVPTHE